MEKQRSNLNPGEVEQLDTLKMITGIDDDQVGIRYLDMSGWNVEQAMNLY